MRAVLNAMVAAEQFGGEMILEWRAKGGPGAVFHVAGDPEGIFAPAFLERHLVSREDVARLSRLSTTDSAFEARFRDGAGLQDGGVDAVVMSHARISSQMTSLADADTCALYRKAFDDIAFTPPLELARTLAWQVPLMRDCVAIHLRAGDIVYGSFRGSGRFTSKAIPYPLGDALIAQARADGAEVLVFGEDTALCRALARRHDATFAPDLVPEADFNSLQFALFEICLMSRCRTIHCGNSGFAYLAAWIGGADTTSVVDCFGGRAIVDATLTALKDVQAEVSDLQKAYAASYAVHNYPSAMTDEERTRLVSLCVDLDPENALYRIMEAEILYTSGQGAEADRRLAAISDAEGLLSLEWLLLESSPANVARRKHLRAFEPAARAGFPMAALCLALNAKALGKDGEAKRYAALYLENQHKAETRLGALLHP
ncbi:hypothetical protein [Jannaschia sp. M317]|uniref:hypothetical protein n=1 Tax=Jannaschia sp. M317 TaxID=2867011 RepID=UPI0021A6FFB2|nr:hypothetical protein [Jannaschia sp. M317]UWQ19670.1 hypothetical protein K3551_18125 [Jannaschia sp. M317]